MKTIFWSSILLLHFHFIPAQSSTLLVVIKDLPASSGTVMIAIYDSEESFLSEEIVAGAKVECTKALCQAEFQNMPFGEYAISIYYDENNNGELDTNWLGIPKEAYAFSNNAKGRFGPPSFDDAKFNLNNSSQSVTLTF